MSTDLYFHVVSRRKWPQLNTGGEYKPEDFTPEEGILLISGDKLNELLNERYKGRKNLFLLVIDKARLKGGLKKDDDTGTIRLTEPLQLEAILDKIRIDCKEDKTFDIEVSAYT